MWKVLLARACGLGRPGPTPRRREKIRGGDTEYTYRSDSGITSLRVCAREHKPSVNRFDCTCLSSWHLSAPYLYLSISIYIYIYLYLIYSSNSRSESPFLTNSPPPAPKVSYIGILLHAIWANSELDYIENLLYAICGPYNTLQYVWVNASYGSPYIYIYKHVVGILDQLTSAPA